MLNSYLSGEGATHKNRKCSLAHIIQEQRKGLEVYHTGFWLVENVELLVRGIFKKFPHFYIFAGNGEGGRSSNWSCLRVSCD